MAIALPIQLVVFDMAGTTVQDNGEVEHCFLQAADRTHLNAPRDRVVAMMGWTKRLVFEILWAEQIGQDHPEYADKVQQSYQCFTEILEQHYQTETLVPTEGCLDTFDWLRSLNISIALTTGFYRKVTDIILKRLNWHQGLDQNHVGSETALIQVSVTPSEIHGNEGRPAPFMIQKAMYRLGICDPKTVVVIGDTPADLAAGMNAHCYTGAVTNGTHLRSQLLQHPHHFLIDNLSELKSIISHL